MSSEVVFDSSELVALGKELAGTPEKVAKEISSAIGVAAAQIQMEAKYIAPVDTGNLRGSIKTRRVSELEAVITPTANYAVFVEYGTRYMGAQPFMRPAADAVMPSFEAAIAKIAGDA